MSGVLQERNVDIACRRWGGSGRWAKLFQLVHAFRVANSERLASQRSLPFAPDRGITALAVDPSPGTSSGRLGLARQWARSVLCRGSGALSRARVFGAVPTAGGRRLRPPVPSPSGPRQPGQSPAQTVRGDTQAKKQRAHVRSRKRRPRTLCAFGAFA